MGNPVRKDGYDPHFAVLENNANLKKSPIRKNHSMNKRMYIRPAPKIMATS